LVPLLQVTFPDLERMFFFSDGGPHHFRLALNFFLTVSLACGHNVDIMWSFHMGYHGKSIYDPEGGAVKVILLHLIRTGQIQVQNAEQFIQFAQQYCSEPAAQYSDKVWTIRRRHFLLLRPAFIDRTFSEEKQVDSITGVHQTYVFRTVREGKDRKVSLSDVDTRGMTCICDACLTFAPGCSFLNTCGPWKRQEFDVEHSKKRGEILRTQLFNVLYSHFRVHLPSLALFSVLRLLLNSSPGQKSPFRTVLNMTRLQETFADMRLKRSHDAGCPCTSDGQDFVRPVSNDWKQGLDDIVCTVLSTMLGDASLRSVSSLGVLPLLLPPQQGVPLPPPPGPPQQQPPPQQAAFVAQDPLVFTDALLTRRCKYHLPAHGGWCFGSINKITRKRVYIHYDGYDDANGYFHDRPEVERDYTEGSFVLL